MQLKEHIGKVFWAFADKALFILYGFIMLFQIKHTANQFEYGLFALMINLNSWVLVLSDSFALQGIVQFGNDMSKRKKIDALSLILHLSTCIALPLIIFSFHRPIGELFRIQNFYMISVGALTITLLAAPRSYMVKIFYRDYHLIRIFLTNLAFFGTMTAVSLYFIYNKPSLTFIDFYTIYLWGSVIGAGTAIAIGITKISFDFKGIGVELKKYIKFGAPMTFIAILHSIPRNLDVYLIQLLFGNEALIGVYNAAKTLYRLFDEASSAAYGLIYPSAVKKIAAGNIKELADIITKAVSFMFAGFLVMGAFLFLGGAQWLVTTFLNERFYSALGLFDIFVIASFFLPFISIATIITAMGKVHTTLKYVIISTLSSVFAFIIIGLMKWEGALPIGIIVYNAVLGGLSFFYIKKWVGFPVKSILRAFTDTRGFVKSLVGKQ
ncbi:MAG: lipopolysaccharide biosynthesis protein [Chloroflexota bacterium]